LQKKVYHTQNRVSVTQKRKEKTSLLYQDSTIKFYKKKTETTFRTTLLDGVTKFTNSENEKGNYKSMFTSNLQMTRTLKKH
jgi:hypothetical protein